MTFNISDLAGERVVAATGLTPVISDACERLLMELVSIRSAIDRLEEAKLVPKAGRLSVQAQSLRKCVEEALRALDDESELRGALWNHLLMPGELEGARAPADVPSMAALRSGLAAVRQALTAVTETAPVEKRTVLQWLLKSKLPRLYELYFGKSPSAYRAHDSRAGSRQPKGKYVQFACAVGEEIGIQIKAETVDDYLGVYHMVKKARGQETKSPL